MGFCLAMLLTLRVCFVASFLSLVVASHHHRDQDGEDDKTGEIVIEHRHRPRVHKSYGSGQYVIPPAALLPQHQHHLGDDQEPEDYFDGGGKVPDGQDSEHVHIDNFNEDDTEELQSQYDGKYVETREMAKTGNQPYMAGGYNHNNQNNPRDPFQWYDYLIDYSDEEGNNIGKLGARGSEAIFENILGSDNLASNGSGKSKDERDSAADGESEKVEKKEGSRAALRKLLRLLFAAYI